MVSTVEDSLSEPPSSNETELQEIFNSKWILIENQATMNQININTWRDRTIAMINAHADEQVRVLEHEKQQSVILLREIYEENMLNMRHATEAQLLDFQGQLLSMSRLLTIQVAQLENQELKLSSPRVLAICEQNERKNVTRYQTNVSNIDTPLNNNRLKPSECSIANGHKNQSESQEDSSNRCYLDTTEKLLLPSVESNNLDDCCPHCFMIFRPDMNDQQREKHVNTHWAYVNGNEQT